MEHTIPAVAFPLPGVPSGIAFLAWMPKIIPAIPNGIPQIKKLRIPRTSDAVAFPLAGWVICC